MPLDPSYETPEQCEFCEEWESGSQKVTGLFSDTIRIIPSRCKWADDEAHPRGSCRHWKKKGSADAKAD